MSLLPSKLFVFSFCLFLLLRLLFSEGTTREEAWGPAEEAEEEAEEVEEAQEVVGWLFRSAEKFLERLAKTSLESFEKCFRFFSFLGNKKRGQFEAIVRHKSTKSVRVEGNGG